MTITKEAWAFYSGYQEFSDTWGAIFCWGSREELEPGMSRYKHSFGIHFDMRRISLRLPRFRVYWF